MTYHFKRTSAALLVTALLTACGGGGGTLTNIASGVASKGPLNGATVCAYAIAASGQQGAQIGNCTTTDATGNYSVDLGGYTGPVLFKAEGGSYIDEATATKVNLSAPLRTMVANASGGPMSVAITALTELAYQGAVAQTGGLSSANIQSATASVQNNFGIADITGTQPVDALNLPGNATEAQKNYALALAGVSQYLTDSKTDLGTGLATLQACLATPATGCGSGATSVGATLSTAITTFTANHSAYTGLRGSTGRVAFFGSVTAAPSNGANGATGLTDAIGATGAAGPVVIPFPVDPDPIVLIPIPIWETVSGATQAQANYGYMANNVVQVAVTLPASASLRVGDIIQVGSIGTGGWKILHNDGQSTITKNIRGTSSTPTTGPIIGWQGDAIELQYVAPNTFSVSNYLGTVFPLPTGFVTQGGLTWVPLTDTPYTYPHAATFCSSSFNGLSGWRLPTQPELMALYSSGAMNNQGWELVGTWSSTSDAPDYHDGVFLNVGRVDEYYLWDNLAATCVR